MENQRLNILDWQIRRSAIRILVVLLSSQSFEVLAQSRELDSLKSLVANGSNSNYCDSLYITSVELMRRGDFESANSVVNDLYLAGQQKMDSLQIVRAFAIRASLMRRTGNLDSAMSMYKAALAVAKRKAYYEQSKNILNSLGLLYALEARYDVALKFLFESLQLRKQAPNNYELSVALHNIGFVYQKLENYDKALFYYSESLTLKKQSDDRFDIEQLLLNIGWCYVHKTQYELANEYFDAAFAECSEACSDKFLIDAFLGLGYIAKHQGKFEKAEEHFNNSYLLARKLNNMRQALDNIVQLSEVYIVRNDVALAEKYLVEAEKLINIDHRYRLELARIYRQLSELYGNENNLERRVFFQEKYISLKDSIFNQQVAANLMKAESDYVERENKARIEYQNRIMALNSEIIFRQQVANIAFGLVAILGGTLAIVLARRNKAKQTINHILDQKVTERTQELRRNQELIQRALEEEALLVHKIGSELHSLIATTKGLCFLGRQEMDINRSQEYWRKLEVTTDGMKSTVSRLSEYQNTRSPLEFSVK